MATLTPFSALSQISFEATPSSTTAFDFEPREISTLPSPESGDFEVSQNENERLEVMTGTPSQEASSLPDRIIEEFPIAYKRKLFGSNLDVVESLEKIKFVDSPEDDGRMGLNIAYLALWKRGNISYKSTIDNPEELDTTVDDKSSEDCLSVWAASTASPVAGETIEKCADPKDWEFSDTKLSPFDPNEMFSLEDYDFGDSEFANPFERSGVGYDLNEFSTNEIFSAMGRAEENRKNRLNIIRENLIKGQNTFFKGQNIHLNNIEIITGRELEEEIDPQRKLSNLTLAYDKLRNDLVASPEATRVAGFNLIGDAFIISQELLSESLKDEKTSTEEIPSDFKEIKGRLSEELIALRLRIKSRFISEINLDENEPLIDRITQFRGDSIETIKEITDQIIINSFFTPGEDISGLKNLLDQIVNIHEQYLTQKEEFNVLDIETIPLPDDYVWNKDDVFVAEPNAAAERWRFPGAPGYQGNYDKMASLSRPDGIWQFMFNPSDLKHALGPKYAEAGTWANNDGVPLHWTGNMNQTLTFSKVILNGYMFGRKVENLLDGIKELVSVSQPSGAQSPPVLEFIWGKKYFGPCMLEGLTIQETMWDEGQVVNAEVSFTLKQVPDWIVNDGYVSIFDPTGRPVVEIPERLDVQEEEIEETIEDGPEGEDTSSGSTASSSSDNNGGKSTGVANTACAGAIKELAQVKSNLDKMLTPESSQGGNPIQAILNRIRNTSLPLGQALAQERRRMGGHFTAAENILKGSNNAIIKNINGSFDTNRIAIALDRWESSVTTAQQRETILNISNQLRAFNSHIQSKLKGFSCPNPETVSFENRIRATEGPIIGANASDQALRLTCQRMRNAINQNGGLNSNTYFSGNRLQFNRERHEQAMDQLNKFVYNEFINNRALSSDTRTTLRNRLRGLVFTPQTFSPVSPAWGTGNIVPRRCIRDSDQESWTLRGGRVTPHFSLDGMDGSRLGHLNSCLTQINGVITNILRPICAGK